MNFFTGYIIGRTIAGSNRPYVPAPRGAGLPSYCGAAMVGFGLLGATSQDPRNGVFLWFAAVGLFFAVAGLCMRSTGGWSPFRALMSLAAVLTLLALFVFFAGTTER